MQHVLDDDKRTTYYRRQASACATAAVATAIAEVKQAYLELEQGWLCLAPKPKDGLDRSSQAEPASSAEATAGQVSSEKVAGAVTNRRNET